MTQAQPSDIAVIGMGSVFPGAANPSRFWSNTLQGIDAITEVPADRWDWRLYYDPDPKAPDKIVSKWGGFLPDVTFDPLKYGMPPSTLPSIEPAQFLALEVVRKALADAGYADRPFPREQTAVVLGMGGGAAQVAMGYAFRSYLPMLDTVIPGGGRQAIESCRGLLPEWTEDSFPGFPARMSPQAGSPIGSTSVARITRSTPPVAPPSQRPLWPFASWRPARPTW